MHQLDSRIKSELKTFAGIVGVFLLMYYAPLDSSRVQSAILEAFRMAQDYARAHVLLCLVPALFIAGAMQSFVSRQSVIAYLGKGAKRWVAYSVAAVSGTILAVCSCTVLPLFMGIYQRGAGLGPASTFLYSGPAINVLAIIMTARVLGWKIGLARALGAIAFSIVIGAAMSFIFRGEEDERQRGFVSAPTDVDGGRSAWQTIVFFATLVLILVFAAWARPADAGGLWYFVFSAKWYILSVLLAFLAYQVGTWLRRDELGDWIGSTWDFAKKVMPLLFAGVLVSGLLMGMPGADNGLIPAKYIAAVVGGNSLRANLAASVVGALMYFATLTEVPIVQALVGSGMGNGPALALLLAGPALSLPSMLVINSVLGPKKTSVYVLLVVVMATVSGMIFGALPL